MNRGAIGFMRFMCGVNIGWNVMQWIQTGETTINAICGWVSCLILLFVIERIRNETKRK